MASELLLNLGLALIPMVFLWGLSISLRDVSIVDIYWGAGFVYLAWMSSLRTVGIDAFTWQHWALCITVSVWGARLSLYLLWRNWGEGEDPRYVSMRSRSSNFWLTSFLRVFVLQAIVMWCVSLPVQVSLLSGGGGFMAIHGLGLAFWSVGLFFETVGDFQLAQFRKRRTSGQVLDKGLWRYTRHPNYFGDFMVWWGLFLLSWRSVDSAWTAVGPAIMTFFLLRVSGVALLEKDIGQRRPAYSEYIEKTSPFFPWFPKE